MLTVFLVVFVVMLLTVLLMGIGVLCGREPIKGSCGGLGKVGVERACGCRDVCEQASTSKESGASSSPAKEDNVNSESQQQPQQYQRTDN